MILVVGHDLAWHKVGRLQRLHRGEVNRLRDMSSFAGGAPVNVVRALGALGGAGEAIGYAGGTTGQRMEDALRAEGLPCRLVRIAGETRTCTTMVEPGGACTEMIEPSPRVTPAEREQMRRTVAERLPLARMLLITGTTAEGETEDCYELLLQGAHGRGIPVMLDSASLQARRALRASPEILKMSSAELADISGLPTETLEQRVSACSEMARRHGVRWFLITRGPDGIEAFNGTALYHAVPPAVSAANTIGPGDAAAAGAAWVILNALADAGARRQDIFSDAPLLREALLTAATMGTAHCLNQVNGRVLRDDYLGLRDRVRILQLPLPRSARTAQS